MKLTSALDEFGLLQRRRHRGEDAREAWAALAALQEFLVDYSGFQETEEIRSSDLYAFLLEYYPSEEEPEPDVAAALLEVSTEFAVWLVEMGDRTLAPFAARSERLRSDLPRVLEAARILKEHSRRHDLEPPAALVGTEFGGDAEQEQEEEEASPVGTIGSGVNRVARLDTLDYPAAEEDYFAIRAVTSDSLVLQSPQREALSQPPAAPVPIPAAAAALLRPGDIIHAEIAPGHTETAPGLAGERSGWELLEVFGIRPGGYE